MKKKRTGCRHWMNLNAFKEAGWVPMAVPSPPQTELKSTTPANSVTSKCMLRDECGRLTLLPTEHILNTSLLQLQLEKWPAETTGLGCFHFFPNNQCKCNFLCSWTPLLCLRIGDTSNSVSFQSSSLLYINTLKNSNVHLKKQVTSVEWLYNKCIMQIPANISCTLDKESN